MMKKLFFMMMAVLIISTSLLAQEDKKNYIQHELSYIMVKNGMEKKFEAAVRNHINKYHLAKPNQAALFQITNGTRVGWYVFNAGPTTFTDMDKRPNGAEHDADWEKNISPLIEKYGDTEFWRLNADLSSTKDVEFKMLQVTFISINRSEYYRFKAISEKLKKVAEENGRARWVYNKQFLQDGTPSIAIVNPLANWAALDADEWKMRPAFEEIFGEGSFDNGRTEWYASVAAIFTEVWREVR